MFSVCCRVAIKDLVILVKMLLMRFVMFQNVLRFRARWFQYNLFTCSGRDVYRKVQGRDHPVPSTVVNISGTSTRQSDAVHLTDRTLTPSPVLSLSSEEASEEVLTKKEKEEMRIAELGRPLLGEHVKLEVVIEESYEFKVGSRSF